MLIGRVKQVSHYDHGMLEYHGWITVRETAADDDDGAGLRQIVNELRPHTAEMDSPYLLDLRWMSGEPFIHLGGHSDHRSPPDVVQLFEHVAVVCLRRAQPP